MRAGTPPIHFWVPDGLEADFARWDPDREPERHQSGVGHGLLELYQRLAGRDLPVTVGPDAPAGCQLVFHLDSVHLWSLGGADRRVLRGLLRLLIGRPAATAIRGDVPLEFSVRVPGLIEVMPNRSAITRSDQVWLPLLPQRGMIPRAADRRGRLRTVGLMANEVNVPAAFCRPEFPEQLVRLGLSWVPRIRLEDDDAPPPPWHDFSDLDCVLCLRADPVGTGSLRKPATKLINAWVAGAVPIVGDEPAHRELARPNRDCLVVSRPEEVPAALARLQGDSALLARLESGVQERAVEFSLERVLATWETLLTRPAAASGPGRRAMRVTTRWARTWTMGDARERVAVGARRTRQKISSRPAEKEPEGTDGRSLSWTASPRRAGGRRVVGTAG